MFTCIKMKNFKSFKNVTIDFSKKKNKIKSLATIYGINGSGKTTIAQAFYLLKRTIETMEIKGILNDLLNEKIAPPDNFPLKEDIMIKMLKSKEFILHGATYIIFNDGKMYRCTFFSKNTMTFTLLLMVTYNTTYCG